MKFYSWTNRHKGPVKLNIINQTMGFKQMNKEKVPNELL